jgi:hypothetical protein
MAETADVVIVGAGIIVHGPIAGQLMADLIVHGQARTVDISSMSIERFTGGETPVDPPTFV